MKRAAKKREAAEVRRVAAVLAREEKKFRQQMLKSIKKAKTEESRRRAQQGYERELSAGTIRRRNPTMTKAQKREKARKASVQRRVATALANFLKQKNPGKRYTGATMRTNKGGSITITPIKAVKRGKR